MGDEAVRTAEGAREWLRAELGRLYGEPAVAHTIREVNRAVWARLPGDPEGGGGGLVLTEFCGYVALTADPEPARLRTWCVAGRPMIADLCASPAEALAAARAWMATRADPMPRAGADGADVTPEFAAVHARCVALFGDAPVRQKYGDSKATWRVGGGRTVWLYEDGDVLFLYGDDATASPPGEASWCLRGNACTAGPMPRDEALAAAVTWAQGGAARD